MLITADRMIWADTAHMEEGTVIMRQACGESSKKLACIIVYNKCNKVNRYKKTMGTAT